MIWHPTSWITFHADYTLFYIGMIIGFFFILDTWRMMKRINRIIIFIERKKDSLEPERKKENN